jgi:hypothetical protein
MGRCKDTLGPMRVGVYARDHKAKEHDGRTFPDDVDFIATLGISKKAVIVEF